MSGLRSKRSRRRPHNAKTAAHLSFGGMLRDIARDRRNGTIDGRPVNVSQLEALLLKVVDRALDGSVRDLGYLIRFMALHPEMGASERTETVVYINGHLAAV